MTEHEYRVGPSGFLMVTPEDVLTRYEPGAVVWLEAVPLGADLQPTGRTRRGGKMRRDRADKSRQAGRDYEDKSRGVVA